MCIMCASSSRRNSERKGRDKQYNLKSQQLGLVHRHACQHLVNTVMASILHKLMYYAE